MKLSEYPVPRNKSKRGMHWSASQYPEEGHYRNRLDLCREMGIGWIKFVDDGGASGLNVYRTCWHDYGIIPIVRLYIGTPGVCGPREADAIKRISDMLGFRTYFELCNEPDLRIEWDNDRPTDWLQRSIDAYCDYAPKVWEAGGLPGTFALASGGRDQNFIQTIVEQMGGPDVVQGLGVWISMHNYTINHPIDYPLDAVNQAGEPLSEAEYLSVPAWAWDGRSLNSINTQRARDKNPGATIWTDDTCFRGYQVFAAHAKNAGLNVPLITTEGGPTLTRGDDGRYQKITSPLMCQMIPRMYHEMSTMPEYFAHCHWLLYNTTYGWESDRWMDGAEDYTYPKELLKTTPVGAWGEVTSFSATTPPIEPPEPEEGDAMKPVQKLDWQIPTWNRAAHIAIVGEGWHLVKAEFLTDNSMDHTCYIRCLDNNGQPVPAQVVIHNANGAVERLPVKNPPDFMDRPIWKSDELEIWIDAPITDHVTGLSSQYDSNVVGGHTWHYTYRLTFQYGLPAETPEVPTIPTIPTIPDTRLWRLVEQSDTRIVLEKV